MVASKLLDSKNGIQELHNKEGHMLRSLSMSMSHDLPLKQEPRLVAEAKDIKFAPLPAT